MTNKIIDAVEKVIENYYGKDKIQNITYLSSGRINAVFRVDLKNCEKDRIAVRLRYFNDPEFGQRFGTEIMCDEILQGCINYPKLLLCDSSRKLIPCDYSILDFIDGRSFSTEDGPEKFEQLGQIAKKIHSAKVPEKYKSEFLRDIDGYYKKRFEGIIKNSSRYDKKVYELVKDSMKYYYPNIYKPEEVSLTHHDFHEKNFIVNNDDITVLDWESARVEATEVEFIRAKYYLFNRTTPENVQSFFKGYGKIHFTDNFFMQEIMWLARISNFERTFPPSKSQENYWCSADYLNQNLEDLIKKYKGRGYYTTLSEIFNIQEVKKNKDKNYYDDECR